jgi:hypothetical protein
MTASRERGSDLRSLFFIATAPALQSLNRWNAPAKKRIRDGSGPSPAPVTVVATLFSPLIPS